MSKKDEILRASVRKNGLEKQIVVGSFTWNLITDCMQDYAEQKEFERWDVTIAEAESLGSTKLATESKCKHVWLLMGYACWICDKCDQFEKR
jgi:hypothetical protein